MTNMNTMLAPIAIAAICHEANRQYCQAIGDNSQLPWDDAAEWQRESAVKGVEFRLQNPGADVSAQHESWMREKLNQGWTYGPVKDPEKKQHPCLVSYDKLPEEQRLKDALFVGIVNSFRPEPATGAEPCAVANMPVTHVSQDKQWRKSLDEVLQEMKLGGIGTVPRHSRERALAITKLQEAIMWLGMDLKAINESNPGAAPNPYPKSYDPTSPVVEKTADGLKL